MLQRCICRVVQDLSLSYRADILRKKRTYKEIKNIDRRGQNGKLSTSVETIEDSSSCNGTVLCILVRLHLSSFTCTR